MLYGDASKAPVSERDWAALVEAIAAGDQRALHALYERTHRIVFTLMVRITGNREKAPGISCKLLATDTERNRVSMLVRLDPGTEYPPHLHAGVEELHLLHGELMIGDRKLLPGDYNRAESGSVDRRVWSETGCTCVLLTSCDDVIL